MTEAGEGPPTMFFSSNCIGAFQHRIRKGLRKNGFNFLQKFAFYSFGQVGWIQMGEDFVKQPWLGNVARISPLIPPESNQFENFRLTWSSSSNPSKKAIDLASSRKNKMSLDINEASHCLSATSSPSF